MSEVQQITVYGTRWCGDCHRTRSYLDRNKIAYRWVDVDGDSEAEAFVLKVNRGMRSVPTVVFPDGSILVEPSNAAIASKIADAGLGTG